MLSNPSSLMIDMGSMIDIGSLTTDGRVLLRVRDWVRVSDPANSDRIFENPISAPSCSSTIQSFSNNDQVVGLLVGFTFRSASLFDFSGNRDVNIHKDGHAVNLRTALATCKTHQVINLPSAELVPVVVKPSISTRLHGGNLELFALANPDSAGIPEAVRLTRYRVFFLPCYRDDGQPNPENRVARTRELIKAQQIELSYKLQHSGSQIETLHMDENIAQASETQQADHNVTAQPHDHDRPPSTLSNPKPGPVRHSPAVSSAQNPTSTILQTSGATQNAFLPSSRTSNSQPNDVLQGQSSRSVQTSANVHGAVSTPLRTSRATQNTFTPYTGASNPGQIPSSTFPNAHTRVAQGVVASTPAPAVLDFDSMVPPSPHNPPAEWLVGQLLLSREVSGSAAHTFVDAIHVSHL